LPASQQDELATLLLAEIAECEFDRKLEQTAHKLVHLAEEALADHRAGRTLPFPD
jgi:hypothetical protein